MSFLNRLFGPRSAPAQSGPPLPSSQMHSHASSGMAQQSVASLNVTRRELLRVVLRDTLNRHGIPATWIAAETLTSTSRTGERGIHWRLLVTHWDPRLLTHGVAIQHALIKRVTTFEPLASAWLTGISWQFALDDESQCPPMPHPGVWTAVREEDAPLSAAGAPPTGGAGDVIEGPVRIGAAAAAASDAEADDARADLEKLLALRDADFQEHGDNEATQPMWLRTEPAPLAGRS
jgi:hypothetical protein